MSEPAPRELDRPFFGQHRVGPGRPYQPGFTLNFEAAKELAARHRKFDCPHYDSCLDHAARSKWAGFSCIGCNP